MHLANSQERFRTITIGFLFLLSPSYTLSLTPSHSLVLYPTATPTRTHAGHCNRFLNYFLFVHMDVHNNIIICTRTHIRSV